MSKSMPGRFLLMFLFECVLASILDGLLDVPNLENHQKPLVFQYLLSVFTKSMFAKQMFPDIDSGFLFGSPNDKNTLTNGYERRVLFQHRFLEEVFRTLTTFA